MTMKREATKEHEMKTPKLIDEESPIPPVKKSGNSILKEKGLGWAYLLPFSLLFEGVSVVWEVRLGDLHLNDAD